nr:hypothetical protein [Halobacterium salinarum]
MSTGSSQAVDASRIGKLAFIGSAGGRGAVVVWANWTEEHFADFVGVDSSTDRQAEMRHGRPMYTTGGNGRERARRDRVRRRSPVDRRGHHRSLAW